MTEASPFFEVLSSTGTKMQRALFDTRLVTIRNRNLILNDCVRTSGTTQENTGICGKTINC